MATTASATSCSLVTTPPGSQACSTGSLRPSGDPFADLAYLCMGYHHEASRAARSRARIPTVALRGFPASRRLLEEYCRLAGIGEIPHWRFYLAFSFFRLAAILQGVYRRGLDGNASSREALSKRELVRVCAETGWRLLRIDTTHRSDMSGKVALITGSSRGIGRAIAEAFCGGRCARVVVSSRNRGRLRPGCVREFAPEVAEAVAVACNVSDRDAVDSLGEQCTAERLGPIDVLVGNAATNPYFGPLLEIEDRAWDKVMAYERAQQPVVVQPGDSGHGRTRRGRVILVSSIAAFKGDDVRARRLRGFEGGRDPARAQSRRGVGSGGSPGQRHRPRARANGIRSGLWEDDGRRRLANGSPRFVESASRRHRGRRRVPRFRCGRLCHRSMHRGRRRRDGCRSGRT